MRGRRALNCPPGRSANLAPLEIQNSLLARALAGPEVAVASLTLRASADTCGSLISFPSASKSRLMSSARLNWAQQNSHFGKLTN